MDSWYSRTMALNERVARIVDGDTFITVSRQNSVRLAGMNAPEKRQSSAVAATNALRSLIGGKTVSIETVGRSYGRAVAYVWIDGRPVNAVMRKMIKRGRR